MSPQNVLEDQPGSPLPLDGLLVADFSRVLAGPLASMFLADLGATVIKVERPGSGDDTRSWGPPYVGTTTTYYTSVNRNKRSVTLDLTDSGDLELARRLARRADVLLENYRPGKLAEFGLDAATVAGEPQAGLLLDLRIRDRCWRAPARLRLRRTGRRRPDEHHRRTLRITGQGRCRVGDVLTGLHATIGILAALRERERSGRGQVVGVNLLSSLLSSLVNQGAAYINGAGVPSAMGNKHPSIAPYETLQTRDGPIAVAVGNDRQFAAMAASLDRPELATDPRFAANRDRVVNRPELHRGTGIGAERRGRRPLDRSLAKLRRAVRSVNDIGEAIELATRLGPAPGRASPVVRRTGHRDAGEPDHADTDASALPRGSPGAGRGRQRRPRLAVRRPDCGTAWRTWMPHAEP